MNTIKVIDFEDLKFFHLSIKIIGYYYLSKNLKRYNTDKIKDKILPSAIYNFGNSDVNIEEVKSSLAK